MNVYLFFIPVLDNKLPDRIYVLFIIVSQDLVMCVAYHKKLNTYLTENVNDNIYLLYLYLCHHYYLKYTYNNFLYHKNIHYEQLKQK